MLQSDRPEVWQQLRRVRLMTDRQNGRVAVRTETNWKVARVGHKTVIGRKPFRAADAMTNVPSDWNNEPLITWSSCSTVDG